MFYKKYLKGDKNKTHYEKNISDNEILKKLCKFNTPTVSNVVATYSNKKRPYCLGIYDQWKDRWYTDQSVHGIFPEKGSRAGHALTLVVTIPGLENNCPKLSREEYVETLYNAKKTNHSCVPTALFKRYFR